MGGGLALLGTTYLAFSGNKRESIAAAERQLSTWHALASGPEPFFSVYAPGSSDAQQRAMARFASHGPYLWGDEEAWQAHKSVADMLFGATTLERNTYYASYNKLIGTAPNRIATFSKIVEDMKRRSVWSFVRTNYVHRPADYRYHILK